MSNDTNVSTFIDEMIDKHTQIIEHLTTIKNALDSIEFLQKPDSPKPEPVGPSWYIPSRSGGGGHRITHSNNTGEWSCNCEAGERGVACWATKEMMKNLNRYDRTSRIWDARNLREVEVMKVS
jgi:hypothetical protein